MDIMKRIIIIVASVLLLIMSCRQRQNQPKSTHDKFNLDFEQVENGMPVGWDTKGGYDYIFSSDSIIVKSGKYSASIEMYEGTPQFGVLGLIIHNNYEGKRVTLSGYVKSENVDDYASLLMRIDPEIGVKEVKIKGTTDWKKYEVSLKMNPRKTKAFAVGAILVGKGKVWFDDVRICIDGKDINELESVEIERISLLSI